MENLSNENIIHVSKANIEYIQFKKMLKYPKIKHCYTLKTNKLNFLSTCDELQASYQKICDELDINKNNIIRPKQKHTDKVEVISNNGVELDGVDGIITDKYNIGLCTTSADCTSLIFYDPIKNIIGNTHSGWRGTLQKIGQITVKRMIDEYRCNPKNIICCICPHIRKCHFEVDEDVKDMFKDEFKYTGQIEKIIETGKSNSKIQKYYIDTTLINKIILKEIGLKEENIIDSNICTVCQKDKFHSYRSQKDFAGRNIAIIIKQK